MTLILSLLIFDLGFLVGAWWATRIARRRPGAEPLPDPGPQLRVETPRAPVAAFDSVASQN